MGPMRESLWETVCGFVALFHVLAVVDTALLVLLVYAFLVGFEDPASRTIALVDVAILAAALVAILYVIRGCLARRTER
jgi:hypothetical protein